MRKAEPPGKLRAGSLAKMPKRDSDRGRRQTSHGGAVAGAAAGTKDVPGKRIVAIRPKHSQCACPQVGAKLGKDPQHGLADLGGDAGREAVARRTGRRRTACGDPATGRRADRQAGIGKGPVMADRTPAPRPRLRGRGDDVAGQRAWTAPGRDRRDGRCSRGSGSGGGPALTFAWGLAAADPVFQSLHSALSWEAGEGLCPRPAMRQVDARAELLFDSLMGTE